MKAPTENGYWAKCLVLIICIIAVLFIFTSCERESNDNIIFLVGKVVEINSTGYIILESGENLYVTKWHNPLIGTVILGETYKFKVHIEMSWGIVVDSIYYYEDIK
jgi:hypothetical protein